MHILVDNMYTYVPITVAAIEFILLLFLWFTKSYSEKKGENQAIKEDIGKITTIVEGIKKDLSDNTEKLKSDLALKNEHIISIRSIERDSLVNYYKETYSLINYIKRIDFTIYTVSNYDDMYNIRIEIDKEFSKYDLSIANVELFFGNIPFMEKSHELLLLMLKLAHIVNKNSLGYKYLLNSAAIELEHKKEDKAKIYKTLHEKQVGFMDEFYKERTQVYSEIVIKAQEVKNMVKNRLQEILND